MSKDLREIYERAEQNAKNRKDPDFKLHSIPYKLELEIKSNYDSEKIKEIPNIFTEILQDFISVVKEDFDTKEEIIVKNIELNGNSVSYKYYNKN